MTFKSLILSGWVGIKIKNVKSNSFINYLFVFNYNYNHWDFIIISVLIYIKYYKVKTLLIIDSFPNNQYIIIN